MSSSAFSAETKTLTPDKQYGAVKVTEDSTLKKLLSVPGVDLKYKDCQKRFPTSLEEIPGCVWEEVSKDPDQRKKVQELYAQESKASATIDSPSRTPSSEATTDQKSVLSSGLTSRKVNIGIDYKSDPATKVLSDFFGKKLEEVLRGSEQDRKDKKIMAIDQSKFVDLYKSELGKSIVNAFTSYCMDTPKSCRSKDATEKCLFDEDSAKTNRNKNIKELRETATFSSEEGAEWERCIRAVPEICYDENIASSKDKDKVYSNTKACLIMDFVKASRKNIIAAEEQEKFYRDLQDKSAQGIAINAQNIKVIDEKDLASDKLTQLNSADISKDFKDSNDKTTSVSKTLEATEKEAVECEKKLGNDENCKKFLSTNTEKNTEAITAFGIGRMAQEDDLKERLNKDENVATYLKEEGYDDGQIKEMLKKENIDDVKKKITERFKNENAAIIKEMAERVANKTSTKDGTIDNNDDSKMKGIREELASRNDDLKDLIHFNNIVSSYLTITPEKKDDKDNKGKPGEASRNTASLHAEVGSMDAKEAKDLKARIDSNKDLKENQNSTSLGISTINTILNYIKPKSNDQ